MVQLTLLTLGLTLGDILYLLIGTSGYRLMVLIFLGLGALYMYLVWRALTLYLHSRIWQITTGLLACAVLVASALAEFPGGSPFSTGLRTYILGGIHTAILGLEVCLSAMLIKSVFLGHMSLGDRLWATAAAYLCMAICFGSIYDLLLLASPLSFGFPVQAGFRSYAESIHFSLVSMVKMPGKFSNASSLFRAIALIQAVWNDLFIALLVGNILAKK
jgi:hypothetical protein